MPSFSKALRVMLPASPVAQYQIPADAASRRFSRSSIGIAETSPAAAWKTYPTKQRKLALMLNIERPEFIFELCAHRLVHDPQRPSTRSMKSEVIKIKVYELGLKGPRKPFNDRCWRKCQLISIWSSRGLGTPKASCTRGVPLLY